KKNVHPGKIVSTSQEVEVMVLDADPEKRRISLGLKQCLVNPWDDFANAHPVGSLVEGEVKNITEFGLFIGLPGEIDGMAHLSDLSWDKPGEKALADYAKGDKVQAKVLDVDVEKERISLGVKQLTDDPFESGVVGLKRGDIVTCTVIGVQDAGIEVKVGDSGMTGFIRKADLSRDRSEQRPDRFAADEKVDAKITQIDHSGRRVGLSIKALEIQEEKKAMAEYGSSDAGASLGDILGAAIQQKREEAERKQKAEAERKSSAKKKAAAKAEEAEKAAEAPVEVEAEAETEAEPEAKPKKAKAKAKAKADSDESEAEAEE
ncbi:MAG: S1 RNA-binding domain-containing protein, partial [Rhodospirillales bacterium]|nr:S1 RNA-binding domain-containing protein [Rhodospirillales bacterium]